MSTFFESNLAGFLLLCAHAASTLVMVGVIWVCQIVHYPLFARVPAAAFVEYERSHMRRISAIVGPAMGIELLASVLILLHPPVGVPLALAALGVALVGVNAASTALLQGPTHNRLATGFDPARIRFLVTTNWIRTAAWSTRGAIALSMLGLFEGRIVP